MGLPQRNSTRSFIFLSSHPPLKPPFLQTSGIWDPTAALNNHNLNASDSSALSGTSTSTATGGSNPSSTSNASSSKSTSNAGAIAGGTVGGVLAIALIGLGAFIFIRRRRRALATPASAQFGGNTGGRGEKVDLTGHSFGGIATPALPMQTEPPRLYVRQPNLIKSKSDTPTGSLRSYHVPFFAYALVTRIHQFDKSRTVCTLQPDLRALQHRLWTAKSTFVRSRTVEPGTFTPDKPDHRRESRRIYRRAGGMSTKRGRQRENNDDNDDDKQILLA